MRKDEPDVQIINELAALLDWYNNSGDDGAIVDNDGAIIPQADPNGVKEYMDITVSDCQ